jgi:hypothetical protein
LTCWNADRLDRGRVGITPDPRRLGTDAARNLLAWAHERAIEEHEPGQVLTSWGVDPQQVNRIDWPHYHARDVDGRPENEQELRS